MLGGGSVLPALPPETSGAAPETGWGQLQGGRGIAQTLLKVLAKYGRKTKKKKKKLGMGGRGGEIKLIRL